MSWTRWFRGVQRKSKRPTGHRRPQPSRPALFLESLEERTVPSVNAASATDPNLLSDTAAGFTLNGQLANSIEVTGAAAVSSNGRYVVFTDAAANLATGQVMNSKTTTSVFLYDRSTGTTTLVSHAASSTATTADGTSENAAISADGNWVAYVSNGDNLVSGQQLADDTYNLTVYGYTGGTFTLSYGGQTTAPIAYNFDGPTELANIQAALDNLSTVGPGNSVVAQGNLNSLFTVTFTGALAHGASTGTLTGHGSGLTGGSLYADFALTGAHNTSYGSQYNVFLYSVQTGQTTLVSHYAADQGAGYQTTASDGTSGILSGFGGSDSSVASQTTSVSLSANGQYVAYLSTGTHLVSGQVEGFFNPVDGGGIQGRGNVFVYDRTTDTNFLASHDISSPTNSAGLPIEPSDNTCYVATIDPTGTNVAFTSLSASLVQGETDGSSGQEPGDFPQFFLAQRPASGTWAGETTYLVSHQVSLATLDSLPNTSGPLDYPAPVFSADGHWLVYMSDHAIVTSPLTPGAGMGDNYYLYDTTQPTSGYNNTLITHTPGNATQVGNAGDDSFTAYTAPTAAVSDSDTAPYVAFYSAATNLESTATSPGYNAYLFSAATGNVTLLSHQSIPTSAFPTFKSMPLTISISGNGRYVGYIGSAAADVSGTTNINTWSGTRGFDAIVYDQGPNIGVSSPAYILASHAYASPTTTGNAEAYAPVISDDGSTMLYLDDSSNLLPTTINSHPGQDLNDAVAGDGTDLYAYSLSTATGYTPLAAVGTNATVSLRNANLPSLTANGMSEMSPENAVSSNGQYTVFFSNAPNLAPNENDTALSLNVYLYNRSAPSGTNPVTLISHAYGSPATTANGISTDAVISADGSTILFYSTATNLISGGTSGTQLYLYDNNPNDAAYGTVKLVSHASTGDTTGSNGTVPVSPGYPPTTLLYDNATAQGLPLPSVSSNGQYIAYLSNASNITGTGSSGLNGSITAVTDPLLGTVKITTTSTAGLSTGMSVTIANAGGVPDIDGTWTITLVNSTQFTLNSSLGLGETYTGGGTWTTGGGSNTNVFLYDRANDATTLVSAQNGTTTSGNGNASTVAISADGSTVAFTDNATNLLSTSITTSGARAVRLEPHRRQRDRPDGGPDDPR